MYIMKLMSCGSIRSPVYYIMVGFKGFKRSSVRFVEKLGFINPNFRENFFFLNSFSLGFWLNSGAKLNPTVYKYLFKFLVEKEKK